VLIKQLSTWGRVLLIHGRVAAQARRSSPHRYRPTASAASGPRWHGLPWNRVGGYLKGATQTVSLLVQIESRAGSSAARDRGDRRHRRIFLAGRWPRHRHLGDRASAVTGAVTDAIKAITAAGKPSGVNAFPRDSPTRTWRRGRGSSVGV